MEQWLSQVLDSFGEGTGPKRVVTMMDCVDVVQEEIVEGMEDGEAHDHRHHGVHADGTVHAGDHDRRSSEDHAHSEEERRAEDHVYSEEEHDTEEHIHSEDEHDMEDVAVNNEDHAQVIWMRTMVTASRLNMTSTSGHPRSMRKSWPACWRRCWHRENPAHAASYGRDWRVLSG